MRSLLVISENLRTLDVAFPMHGVNCPPRNGDAGLEHLE